MNIRTVQTSSSDGVRAADSTVPGALVVASGELDLATAPQLRAVLVAAVEAPGAGACLDLSGITFIDSYGLRVLIEVHKLAQRVQRRLMLVASSPVVANLFAITGLEQVMPLLGSGPRAGRDSRADGPTTTATAGGRL